MTIAFDTLFGELGKGFYVQQLVNTARGSTVPPAVLAFVNAFGSRSLAYQDIVDGTATALDNYQSSGSSLTNSLKTTLANVVIQAVADDVSLQTPNLQNSLAELIRQMKANTKSVKSCTVTVSASGCTGNGNGALVASIKRADGLRQQTALVETLTLPCTSDNNPATASFTAYGEAGVSDPLSWLWPAGSGISTGLTATNAARNTLLTNGGMDASTVLPGVPDGWLLSVGTPGTTIRMSAYEVQQVAVSGPPTAGFYVINWTNPAGQAQSTNPLAWNATGAAVQSALRQLEGLGGVTVASTGTSPNFTHVITFTGAAGNLAQVAVNNATTGGSFAVSTVSDGDALAYVHQAVILDSDGSELTTLNQAVSLAPLTQYAFNGFFAVDTTPAAGVVTVDLVDGIAGTVIQDAAGTDNSFAIAASGLTSTFSAHNGTFRTPRILPPVVYLRIRVSTAIDSTTLTAIDHCALVKASDLYSGGPAVALFSGSSPFTAGDGSQNPADYFTLTVTNDYGGLFQNYFERNFALAAKNLVLPSVTDGSETEADSMIG